MGDHLDDFLLLDAVVQRTSEMADLLLGAIERDQGGAGDQAAVALAKAGALPDVAEQRVVGELDQLGAKARSASRAADEATGGLDIVSLPLAR